MYSNFYDLQLTLANLKFDPDILILTESQLNPNKPIPTIPEYSRFQTTNHINKNDGVVVYITNKIKSYVKEIKLDGASCLEIKLVII